MQAEYEELLNEVDLVAQSQGLLKSEAFFKIYTDAAVDSGDIEDAQYCPVLHEGRPSYRIDGYYLNAEQGELGLLICDFRPASQLQNVNAAECESLFVKVLRFFQNALSAEFVSSLEDSSPAFQAAWLIHSARPQIKRVRVVVLTSGRLSVRKALTTTTTDGGIRFTCSVLDFQRYHGIESSRRGVDPVEIDLTESPLAPLPCLVASSDDGRYASYLVVVPGKILAEIYGLYGARLLESNVRSFLQAKTKVNKGIQATIKNEPQNFFAYNNGLTATASEITIKHSEGLPFITNVRDLQIVNGGQTTASILYARDKERRDLEDVFVQMKLSVVSESATEELVPNISRFANSQNKISDADFFSSHPFHLQMERMSRRLSAPVRDGATSASKWFYERARGQFKDAQAYLSPANKKKFEIEFPKDQMIDKTDLAKYELSFQQSPHLVSQGSQKCFLAFADVVQTLWDPDATEFGDGYYRDAMARASIFRWTDRMIGDADWYQSDRGYKAQTVTYTIALLAHLLEKQGRSLDHRKIWNKQEPTAGLKLYLGSLAPQVAAFLRRTPDSIRNVGEYCKRPVCWKNLCGELGDANPDLSIDDFSHDKEEAQKVHRENRETRKIDSGIDAQAAVFKRGGEFWASVRDFVHARKLGSPTERGVLDVCVDIPTKIPTEKQSTVALRILATAESEGFDT